MERIAPMPFTERLATFTDPDACWPWPGCTTKGYAMTQQDGQQFYVHRRAYELLVGPIPTGLTLDHLCRNRRCFNPRHLEPVTIGENVRRGDTFLAANIAKTHCPRGHAYAGRNLYIDADGGRRCHACDRIRYRERYRPHPRPVRTHCVNGHELTGNNIRMLRGTGGRRCVTCHRQRRQRRRQEHRT